MAATPVEIIHGTSGLTDCTLVLYPLGSDDIANGDGDALTARTNRTWVYRATVAEELTGRHEAYMVDGDGNVLYTGVVDMQNTTDVHTVRELSAADVAIGPGDIEDIVAGIAATGTLLVQYSIQVSDDQIDPPASQGLTTGYILCLGADGLPESGVVINAKLYQGPGTAGYAFDTGVITMTSAANGIAQHTGFVRGAYYRFRRGTGPWTNEALAPDTDTWALREILGQA